MPPGVKSIVALAESCLIVLLTQNQSWRGLYWLTYKPSWRSLLVMGGGGRLDKDVAADADGENRLPGWANVSDAAY